MSKYIDPEAFFKVINTLPYKDTSYPDASVYNGAISDVADMLTHFPAADVQEVRHGEWEYGETVVHSGDGYLLGVGCRCSVCHKPPFVICGTLVKTDYCPFCGALMVNKDE